MSKQAIILCFMLFLLGCGQAGPLYLPKKPTSRNENDTVPSQQIVHRESPAAEGSGAVE